jgi:hypothetical protein
MTKRSGQKPSNPMRAMVGMGYGGILPAKIAKHLKKSAATDQQKSKPNVTTK